MSVTFVKRSFALSMVVRMQYSCAVDRTQTVDFRAGAKGAVGLVRSVVRRPHASRFLQFDRDWLHLTGPAAVGVRHSPLPGVERGRQQSAGLTCLDEAGAGLLVLMATFGRLSPSGLGWGWSAWVKQLLLLARIRTILGCDDIR
ncbi:hypothetical protein [Saccharopolyspora shandongensis]|uniref:hypothetical protein n=1 Tax=Saccharopolyspora shandongensis TaxID=418495 RepID=UPI00340AA9C3